MVTHRPRSPVHVLVVCRFNQARSPLATSVLRSFAQEHDLRPLPVVVSSGLFADADQSLLPEAGQLLAERGFDKPDPVTRRFRLHEAREAALVITFERALVRDIVAQDTDLAGRTFTLRELRRLVSSPLWDDAWNGGPALVTHLNKLRPRVPAGDDDTPDPTRGRGRATRRVLVSVVEDTIAVAPAVLGITPVGRGHSRTRSPSAESHTKPSPPPSRPPA